MAVPGTGTSPLDNPDHTAEHARLSAQLLDDLPRGIVAYVNGNLQGAAVTTVVEIFRLSNVPLQARRLYLFAFTVRAIQYNVASAVQFTLAGTTIKHCTLYIDMWKTNVAGATHDCVYFEEPFTVDSDVIIPYISLQINGANNNVWTNHCFMLVRDIGPDRGKV